MFENRVQALQEQSAHVEKRLNRNAEAMISTGRREGFESARGEEHDRSIIVVEGLGDD